MTIAVKKFVYTRPWLYPKQLDAFFCPERYGIVEASTKSGKTVGMMAWLYEMAAQGPQGSNWCWLAPVYPQAEIAFTRLQQGLPQEVFTANRSEMTLILAHNQVKIWFKSGEKPDNLYGPNYHGVAIDEFTRLREEAWYAMRSTLTYTRGPVRMVGNVRGRRNWGYRMARRAEGGELGMHFSKIIAHDAVEAGVLATEEVEDAKRTLPEIVFRELYLAEPSDEGANPFGLGAIRECVAPLSEAEAVVWGIDLAKSQDWTVAIALDASGRTCRFERWQGPWEMTIPRIQAMVKSIPALVDSTGVGDPILERLQKEGGNYQGYQFTSQSKQRLMEGLAAAIQRHEVTFPEGPIVDELEEFEYVYSRTGVHYSSPEGLHDDCVCALALAVQHKGRGDFWFI